MVFTDPTGLTAGMPSDIEKQLVDRGVDVQAAQKDAARSGSGGNNNPTPPKPEPPKFDLGKFLNDLGSKLGMWKTHEQVGKEQIGILKDNAALLALYRADHNGQDPVDGHEVSRWVSDFFMGDAIQTDDFMNGLATLAPGLARNLIRNSIDDLVRLSAGRVATKTDQAFFWSGLGGGGADVALKLAQARGGVTLEKLIADRGIKMPSWDPTNPASIDAWKAISQEYAAGASGTVRAILGKNIGAGSIWQTVELPALLRNSNVTRIIGVDAATGAETTILSRLGR